MIPAEQTLHMPLKTRYTWREHEKEHHTNAPFLHWRKPTPYCQVYTAVFGRKRDFLSVPEPLLTEETRQRLLELQPFPTELKPEPIHISNDIPF